MLNLKVASLSFSTKRARDDTRKWSRILWLCFCVVFYLYLYPLIVFIVILCCIVYLWVFVNIWIKFQILPDVCASPHSPPLSSGPPSRTFDPFPPDVERTKSRSNFVWIITNYLNRACPSKSWFSMKIWTPSLLLSRTPPSSSARVLNGQQNLTSFSENKLNPFNFILMYKKIGKLRLKDNCGERIYRWKIHLELCLFLADFWPLPSFCISPALTRVWSYPVAELESQPPGYILKRETMPNIQFLATKLSSKKYSCICKIHESGNTQYMPPNDFSTFWFPRDPSLVTASRGNSLGWRKTGFVWILLVQCQL